MAIKLRETSFEHAKALIEDGETVLEERDDWSEAARWVDVREAI